MSSCPNHPLMGFHSEPARVALCRFHMHGKMGEKGQREHSVYLSFMGLSLGLLAKLGKWKVEGASGV